jgi:glucosamine-6-phosphate deaminase
MKIIVEKDYEHVCKKAAKLISSLVMSKPNGVIGLATGSSALGVYDKLIELYNHGFLDFENVKTFNLDEYVGVGFDNSNSYHHYMYENLFQYINIKKENTFIPNGMAKDLLEECKNYEAKIASFNGIDVQLLGIGSNGHIAFNEPGEKFTLDTHVEELDKSTIEDNSRMFEDETQVPRKSITMGIGSIMKAKKIVVVIRGKNKAKALSQLLYGEVTPDIPASILKLHDDVTVIFDEQINALLEKENCL